MRSHKLTCGRFHGRPLPSPRTRGCMRVTSIFLVPRNRMPSDAVVDGAPRRGRVHIFYVTRRYAFFFSSDSSFDPRCLKLRVKQSIYIYLCI